VQKSFVNQNQNYGNRETQQEGRFGLVASKVANCVSNHYSKPGDDYSGPQITFHKPEDNQASEHKYHYRDDEYEQHFAKLSHGILLFKPDYQYDKRIFLSSNLLQLGQHLSSKHQDKGANCC
jgi:hypothetical protein